MSAKALKIKVVQNGKNCGYVKKINYDNGEAQLTNDKESALKYSSEDAIQSDIDFLTKFYFESGYIFLY
jgi:hypothetical protein